MITTLWIKALEIELEEIDRKISNLDKFIEQQRTDPSINQEYIILCLEHSTALFDCWISIQKRIFCLKDFWREEIRPTSL